MRRRLRPIRDSAAWRIIDAANSIRKSITDEEICSSSSVWEQISYAEGIASFCSFLDVAVPLPSASEEALNFTAFDQLDPADAALCFASILDRIMGAISDSKTLVEEETAPENSVSRLLEEVLQVFVSVQEDLFVVLDDATTGNLLAWLSSSWCQSSWFANFVGTRLNGAMAELPLRRDSEILPEDRQSRRKRLSLMRGLQTLLDDASFRLQLLVLAANPTAGSTSCMATESSVVPGYPGGQAACYASGHALETADFELLGLSEVSVPESPRGYISRKPERLDHECKLTAGGASDVAESCRKESEDPADVSISEEPGQLIRRSSKVLRSSSTPVASRKPSKSSLQDGTPRKASISGSCSTRRALTPSRPATPSWLDPPWPRQEIPFDSWSRPGTPSTVCDEADLAQTPKFKFVDGHCIPLRLGSSSKRLPPLAFSASGDSRRALPK